MIYHLNENVTKEKIKNDFSIFHKPVYGPRSKEEEGMKVSGIEIRISFPLRKEGGKGVRLKGREKYVGKEQDCRRIQCCQ